MVLGILSAGIVLAVLFTGTKPFRWAGRFLAGRPMDGRRRTDATFRHRATRSVDHRITRPSRWSMLAGWHRSAVRVGVLGWGILTGVGMLRHSTPMLAVAALATASCAAAASWRAHVGWGRWQHHRRIVRPLHASLAPLVGRHTANPADYLTIPRGYDAEDGPGVRVDVPDDLVAEPGRQALIVQTVKARTGLGDVDVTWRLASTTPHVLIKPAPQAPKRVGLVDVAAAIAAAPDGAVVLGIGPRRKIVTTDVDAESPHILVSAGSGAGKSVLVRAVAAQGLHKGHRVTFLDPKRVSHRWARQVGGVRYLADTESIHHELIELAAEGDRRFSIIERWDGPEDEAPVGDRWWIAIEEMNTLRERLQQWWEANRTKDDPKRSPAVVALGELLFMGRQARMHVCAVAQMATAQALGGPAARENFSTRCLARYTMNAWRMLVPEVWPMPKTTKHRGRWQIVQAGTATPTQVVFLTEAEAIDLATSGRPAPAPSPEPGRRLRSVPVGEGTTDTPAAPTPMPTPALVGLSEAAETVCAALGGNVVEKLRNARKTDAGFPTARGRRGRENLYDAQELASWMRNRQRAIETESPAG